MWTFREERQQFYLHQYLVQQPDLNYRNPAVKQIMFDNLKFWMDQGVDGFRYNCQISLKKQLKHFELQFRCCHQVSRGRYLAGRASKQ